VHVIVMRAGKNHDLQRAGPGPNCCLRLKLSIVEAVDLQTVTLVDHGSVRITGVNDAIR
jgi:hypothetical protein